MIIEPAPLNQLKKAASHQLSAVSGEKPAIGSL
jgi:hypothetical protein